MRRARVDSSAIGFARLDRVDGAITFDRVEDTFSRVAFVRVFAFARVAVAAAVRVELRIGDGVRGSWYDATEDSSSLRVFLLRMSWARVDCGLEAAGGTAWMLRAYNLSREFVAPL